MFWFIEPQHDLRNFSIVIKPFPKWSSKLGLLHLFHIKSQTIKFDQDLRIFIFRSHFWTKKRIKNSHKREKERQKNVKKCIALNPCSSRGACASVPFLRKISFISYGVHLSFSFFLILNIKEVKNKTNIGSNRRDIAVSTNMCYVAKRVCICFFFHFYFFLFFIPFSFTFHRYCLGPCSYTNLYMSFFFWSYGQ